MKLLAFINICQPTTHRYSTAQKTLLSSCRSWGICVNLLSERVSSDLMWYFDPILNGLITMSN